jgi:hypothetical protein
MHIAGSGKLPFFPCEPEKFLVNRKETLSLHLPIKSPSPVEERAQIKSADCLRHRKLHQLDRLEVLHAAARA